MSLRLFSRAWQEITKLKKKLYDKGIFHPYAGGPCSADCSKFLHVGWHPRRNHAYQILSRSCRGLRSYGGPKSGFSYSFSNRSYNNVSHYRATLWCYLCCMIFAGLWQCMAAQHKTWSIVTPASLSHPIQHTSWVSDKFSTVGNCPALAVLQSLTHCHVTVDLPSFSALSTDAVLILWIWATNSV